MDLVASKIENTKAQCSALVIRPSINSVELKFFPNSILSHVFVHDLVIYDKKIYQTFEYF